MTSRKTRSRRLHARLPATADSTKYPRIVRTLFEMMYCSKCVIEEFSFTCCNTVYTEK